MSGVHQIDDNVTQYHVHVTTRSGQNKPRLIEVDISTNTFTLSNFSNGKSTIAREFNLANLTKFERLQNEVFLRLYFVSPAVSCDLSFPDLESLMDFITLVKDTNPQVQDEVIADEDPPVEENNGVGGTTSNTKPDPSAKDLSADVTETQQQAGVALGNQSKQIDQKKLVTKWRELLSKHGPGKHDAYKAYVRQGIPPAVRAEAWISLSDLQAQKQQAGLGYYRSLITLALNQQYADVNRAIDQGLNLNDPKNAKNDNLHRVCRILRAYNVRNVNVGYSQQLVFVCALLISVLEEEDSFWMMCYFVEKICCVDISAGNNNTAMQTSKKGAQHESSMRNLEKEDKDVQKNHLFYYHHTNQLGLQIDQAAFGSLLQDKLPKIAQKLQQLSIPIPPLTARWFTAILIHTLRADIVLRIWDCILFDGVKALFRAYLSIFKFNEKAILKCQNRGEFIAALQVFASSPIDTNQFISTMYGMWLRSFSVSDIVHYRRLHAKVLISEKQLNEIESSRILTSNLDSQLQSSSVDKQQQEQQQQAAKAAAEIEAEKKREEEQTKAKIAAEKEEKAKQAQIAADTAKAAAKKALNDEKAQHEAKVAQQKAERDRLDAENAKKIQQEAALAAEKAQAPPSAPLDDDDTVEVHPVPSQTQSAPVSRVILRGTHNRLFQTLASQQRAPAINIYGAKRAFSPPLPDCYALGEAMSDYTDEEADEIPAEDLSQHTLPTIVAVAAPAPISTITAPQSDDTDAAPPPPAAPADDDDEAPPPPAPADDEDAPPPPPETPQLTPSVQPSIKMDLPPPIEIDMPPPAEIIREEEIKKEEPVVAQPVEEMQIEVVAKIEPLPNMFRKATLGFRRPGQTVPVVVPQAADDDDDDDLPPDVGDYVARKEAQDEKLREKARQMALDQMQKQVAAGGQKQNIKDVMANITLPTPEPEQDELIAPVPDSSDDEAEQDKQQAEIDAKIDAANFSTELPPNLAEDSDDDDDGIVDPFGKKAPKTPIEEEPTPIQGLPDTPSQDETSPAPEPTVLTPTPSSENKFRKPFGFKSKNDLAEERHRRLSNQDRTEPETPQGNLPSPPQQQYDEPQQIPPTPVEEPDRSLPQTPVEEPQNKAKAIIALGRTKKGGGMATARPKDIQRAHQAMQQKTLPTPPVENEYPAPPPSFDLPSPPPADDAQPQQQETQEAVFWPTEPVDQPVLNQTQLQHNNNYTDPFASITNAVGPMVDPSRRCVHCHQQIFHTALYANNQLWHPECFQCKTCHVPLAGIPYYTNNGNVYCQEHYAQSKGYVCVYCNGVVTEGLTLGANDYAHFDCVHCATCHSRPSQHELNRLANGQSTIANATTFHLSRRAEFSGQPQMKGHYYQFLCNTHFQAQRQTSSPLAASQRAPGNTFHPPGAPSAPASAPVGPLCYRCDLPLNGEATKVQGQQYHKACLTCPCCQGYLADCLKKPQGVLFSEKKKGTFYCCDHTNHVNLTCKKCEEPLGLEQSCAAHNDRFHSYCTTQPQSSQPLPQQPLPLAPQTPRAAAPSAPQTPRAAAPECAMCKTSDPAEACVALRSKPIHKKCLECVTCHITMGTDILKTFPAMMYPAVYRNFHSRQPEFALQDAYYEAHTMSPTNQHSDFPVALICSYCHEAYVKNQ